MSINTRNNAFPLLPLPSGEQDWKQWGGRLVSILEDFFSQGPYNNSFPRGNFSSSELTAQGSGSVTLVEVTANMDGRPILVVANCFAATAASASGGTAWSLKLKRDSTVLASVGSGLQLSLTRADGFVSLPAIDKPAEGRYVYKLVFEANSSIADYRFKNRVLYLMERVV